MKAPERDRAAAVLFVLLLVFPFVGRAVLSSDGAEVLAETLGLFVTGRLEAPTPPPAYIDPNFPPAPPLHSRYGFFPSLLLTPFVALVWPVRGLVGAPLVDAGIALAWPVGTALACWAFLRLARALRPGTSPFWAAGFLAGTPLWPYASDSFFEPYAGAGLALAAAVVLAPRDGEGPGRALAAALAFGAACWLKPVVWVTAPVFVLSAALSRRDGRRATPFLATLLAGLAAAFALALAVNLVRNGRLGDFGYGYASLPFVTSLATGPLGLLAHPSRGLLLYAPVVALSVLVGLRSASLPARVLCFGAPLVLALVSGRWYGWHGGSAWGPRYLVPVLALAVAPAVLAHRKAAIAVLGLGAALNLPGVLVAPGAWLSYVERPEAPPGVAWPTGGGDRMSGEARLSPLYGHAWLLARSAGLHLPAFWLRAGAAEGAPPPTAPEYLSPRVLRAGLGLPAVSPVVPNILYRTAVAALQRGYGGLSLPYAREALRIDPRHRPAADLLGQLSRAGPGRTGKPDAE